MTLANPAVVTINTVAYNLPKINQDNYGSEYLYRDTVFELRLKIRNSKETTKAGSTPVNRHNVELTQTILPTSTTPAVVRQSYAVIRGEYNDADASVSYVTQGLVDFLTDAHIADVLAWQS
ncbi:TPA_asm: coat protein [ssRNA phage Gephyllon.1_26]|jgi:hypothetical protein|uniref:Coat protein n=2 Tax=Leviviricetes TaxID=2842243 RepID=A0A8S5KY48_9VIRU|nr:coat protein [ssRNA phage Gephyllon.1_26]QDH91033.1 MAG: hypothetical protein H1BulkLitter6437_000002 [Leviviridae sp.]DAD50345.1 TPA_asm: coat protein [ssRNA phage Gephyllon.1_26]